MNAVRIVSASSLAVVLALAGCQTNFGRFSRGPVASAPTGIEGEWQSTDGIAISRFAGGVFETVATDTGNKLAEGTYTYRNPTTVDITMTSLIRQTQSAAACAQVAVNQLNCTSSDGKQFVLVRRQAGMT